MNKIANRAWAGMVLAFALFIGMFVIVVRYFRDSEEWYMHHSNSAVYTNGSLNSGMIYDRTKGTQYQGQAFPEFMQKLIACGGLVNYINEQ